MSEPMDLIYKDPKYPSSKVVNGLSMAGPRVIKSSDTSPSG